MEVRENVCPECLEEIAPGDNVGGVHSWCYEGRDIPGSGATDPNKTVKGICPKCRTEVAVKVAEMLELDAMTCPSCGYRATVFPSPEKVG